jgi:PAS domain S-box-containing protein
MDLTKWLAEQRDYLWLVGAAALCFGVLAYRLRRYRSPAQLPRAAWLIALAVLIAGWWATQRAGEHARRECIAQVSALAPTYAYELTRMGHAQLPSDAQPDDPHYLALIEAQIQWEKLNPAVNDIYTMRKLPNGTNILVVDSETDYDRDGDFDGPNEARTPVGKIYPNPINGLEMAFRGEANFDGEVYTDEWGTWVSAFVPLRDNAGQVEAVLGVDFDARSWVAAIGKARLAVIFGVALLLVVVAVAGLAVAFLRADVQRRTAAEQRSRRAEERMQLTIQQMPLGFIEWNPHAEVIGWNPSAENIFGFPAAEVLGRAAFPLIVAPTARESVDQLWTSLLTQTGGTHNLNENVTKDGRIITCEWFNTPLIGVDGKVAGVISQVQDVTERVALEKHLQHSNRMNAVGQLAAGIAHDFNNILTVITGHTGLLLVNPVLPERLHPELGRIQSAAMRAANLTRQLLAFSRKQAMFPQPIYLGKVVENMAAMLSRLPGADVKFSLRVADRVPPVEADAAMIEQVLTNLVLNARDAIPGAGEITVSLDVTVISRETAAQNPEAQTGSAVCLSVSDTGVGIPAEQLARIFEPFFTTKPTGRGTGLGLAVVHGIVQQHKGWITVDSTPGQGTTFRIYFPPTTREVRGEGTEFFVRPAPAAPAKARTILLAEDEDMVRELASATLKNAGYRVMEALDGPEALKLWAQHHEEIDLLLTDMVMPNGITGRELSLRLLAEEPGLPVIYTSGYSIELTAPGLCESERVIFLPKPYLTDQLLSSVNRCLSMPA